MRCPHSRDVTLVSQLGIQIFQHEDGASCDAMNNLSVSADKILAAYARDVDRPLASLEGALLASRKARIAFFDKMQAAQDDMHLVILLRQWFRCTQAQDSIYKELFDAFGMVARSNMVFLNLRLCQIGSGKPSRTMRTLRGSLPTWQLVQHDILRAQALEVSIEELQS